MDPVPPHLWTDESGKVLILRKCYADGTSPERTHFRWPLSGPVEAEAGRNPGDRLHGWPWGLGVGNDMWIDVLTDLWIVFAADPADIYQRDARVCSATRGEVLYAGDFDGAWDLLRAGRQKLHAALKEAGGWGAVQSSLRPLQHEHHYRDHNWHNFREAVRRQFRLRLDSKHGVAHWHMVERWGSRLHRLSRNDPRHGLVVILFAWLHDSQRVNDGDDPGHGERAATFAKEQRGRLFHIEDDLFEKLVVACAGHGAGTITDDPIIGACFDADRLASKAWGEKPDEKLMSTTMGKRFAVTEGFSTTAAPSPS